MKSTVLPPPATLLCAGAFIATGAATAANTLDRGSLLLEGATALLLKAAKADAGCADTFTWLGIVYRLKAGSESAGASSAPLKQRSNKCFGALWPCAL